MHWLAGNEIKYPKQQSSSWSEGPLRFTSKLIWSPRRVKACSPTSLQPTGPQPIEFNSLGWFCTEILKDHGHEKNWNGWCANGKPSPDSLITADKDNESSVGSGGSPSYSRKIVDSDPHASARNYQSAATFCQTCLLIWRMINFIHRDTKKKYNWGCPCEILKTVFY